VSIRWNRAVSLGRLYGAAEEDFDLAEMDSHLCPELRVLRLNFQRGVDQQAAAPIAVDRPLDDLMEKRANRLLRR
jgi:hypothetical protein